MARLTIGITTRNRPSALIACLRSLQRLAHLAPEILVFDDASTPPASQQVPADVPAHRVLRDERAPGYIVGRNALVREASSDLVLLLDDDTQVLSAESVERALEVITRDRRIAAVAFAQMEADGQRWADNMQPSAVRFSCLIPSFIGFAHLLRRDLFLRLGGYREEFVYYGEEKDFCLRLLDAGYRTVYLPDAGIAHVPDRGGRSQSRYLRYVVRNDCLNSLFNDPLSRVWWMAPARYLLYFRMRRGWEIRDPWGWAWIGREIARHLPRVVRTRRPVSRATIRTWKQLRRAPLRYDAPDMRRSAAAE